MIMVYDYSNLLRAIDNAQLEEKKLKNSILANKKDELAELEMEIEQSGLFEDWYQLNEAMKKLGVRGFPYTGYQEKPIGSYAHKFTDGYRFMETMSSGSSWSDYFGISINGITGGNVKRFTWITHGLWNGFRNEENEVTTKIRMLKQFREAYPVYREFKLKEIYAALGKQIETNESLRKEI